MIPAAFLLYLHSLQRRGKAIGLWSAITNYNGNGWRANFKAALWPMQVYGVIYFYINVPNWYCFSFNIDFLK